MECPVCGRRGVRFQRVNRRPAAQCPCGARERHRLMALILADEGVHDGIPKRILHLPGAERSFSRWLARGQKSNHFLGHHNLTRIKQNDNSVDMIIHNHVMEHIKAHKVAYREQHRVLKPGGKLIFSIPVLRDKETGEYVDETVEFDRKLTTRERQIHYGQRDHVRYYGLKGVLDVLTECGFEPKAVTTADTSRADKADVYGLKPWLVAFVAVKPGEPDGDS